MMKRDINFTGFERSMGDQDIIVSKTNLKGLITYGNGVFLDIADYSVAEIIGKPHNIIRHPDMPKCVFKLLWDTIKAGNEIFAYVINQAKNGDYYWVFAHVTPSFDESHRMVGYHSSRRKPSAQAVEAVKGLYKALLDAERKASTGKEAIEAGVNLLQSILQGKGVSYEEFILSL